jgi:hypothetical protein
MNPEGIKAKFCATGKAHHAVVPNELSSLFVKIIYLFVSKSGGGQRGAPP